MPVDVTLHASCVAVDGRGLLILGESGRGKSSLALTLMAWGAELVADDRTLLTLHRGRLRASCPPTIRGRIEARGIGILNVPSRDATTIVAAVDLDREEVERLPPGRHVTFLDHDVPLFLNVPGLHFAAGLLHYLRGTRLP